MGFVGASPLHNVVADWVGALAGVGAVYVWTRWLGRATTCEITARAPRDEEDGRGDQRTFDQPVERGDVAFAETAADGHRRA